MYDSPSYPVDRAEADAFRPLAEGDVCGPRRRRLAAVRIAVEQGQAEFEVGPAGPDEERAVVRRRREQGHPGAARAADAIEATVAPPADRQRHVGGARR